MQSESKDLLIFTIGLDEAEIDGKESRKITIILVQIIQNYG